MFCKICGQELREDTKFCAGCGTPVGEEAAADVNAGVEEQPVIVENPAEPVAPAAPTGGKKPGKGLLIAAAAVVVVVLALILIVSGAFTSAKAKVGEALLESMETYTDAYKDAGLPNPTELVKSQKFSQSLGVTIAEMGDIGYYDLSALEGAGLRANIDTNIPGKKVAISATAYYGSTDLISGQLALDNDEIYVGVPELLGEETFYGLNTTTLGVDLENLGADDEIEDLSFNIFELVEILTDNLKLSKDAEQSLEKAQKDLIKAVVVEKDGKKTVDVNGNDVACTAYLVEIPQDAMEEYFSVCLDVVEETDYEALIVELIQALGFSEGDAEDMLDEMGDMSLDMSEAQDAIEEVLDVLEDIELTVYVKGGRAMAVEYENEIEGVDVTIGVYMGGGKNYADDFSVKFEGKDSYSRITCELVSTGNHTASGGTFTDETTFKVKEDGETYFNLTSEMSYKPKAKENNFSWTVAEKEELGLKVEAEGQLNVSGNKMGLELEELALTVDGQEIIVLEVSYQIDDFKMGVNAKKPVMISTMDEDDLEDLGEDIMDSASDWMDDVMDILEENMPEDLLEELIWMFY